MDPIRKVTNGNGKLWFYVIIWAVTIVFGFGIVYANVHYLTQRVDTLENGRQLNAERIANIDKTMTGIAQNQQWIVQTLQEIKESIKAQPPK